MGTGDEEAAAAVRATHTAANVRTTGALYQSALRTGLTERLGVTWGPSGISQETPPPRFRSGSEDRELPRH